MTETYIQHNPNVPTGRAAFVEFFGKFKKRSAIQPKVAAPLVAITAEGNLVILSFARELADSKDPVDRQAFNDARKSYDINLACLERGGHANVIL